MRPKTFCQKCVRAISCVVALYKQLRFNTVYVTIYVYIASWLILTLCLRMVEISILLDCMTSCSVSCSAAGVAGYGFIRLSH